jgi:4-hydroxybutyryl-CoA dehydratase/vinylacetyl-CoA-Delta-isomerase
MVGVSTLMARANGLSSKTFMDKLVNMSINNQVTFGLGVGACTLGTKHPSNSFIADPLTAHTNKVMVATLPYETKRLTQEIGGGLVETGCMPSAKDLAHSEYGDLLRQYYKAGSGSAESRLKAARLSEWLTIGGGVPGCMHGGGSPDGAKLTVRFATPFEEYADYARNIMDIKEEIQEPPKKK